eukprot:9465841-Pyramimonas_sp.AAC.1
MKVLPWEVLLFGMYGAHVSVLSQPRPPTVDVRWGARGVRSMRHANTERHSWGPYGHNVHCRLCMQYL